MQIMLNANYIHIHTHILCVWTDYKVIKYIIIKYIREKKTTNFNYRYKHMHVFIHFGVDSASLYMYIEFLMTAII